MLNIVLHQPEIPANTGNIGRKNLRRDRDGSASD